MRGCSKEIDPDPTFCPSTNCNVCPDSACNGNLVPKGRLQCYQCNSTDIRCNGYQREVNEDALRPCKNFKYDDKCFMFWDEGNEFGYRGCLSDLDEVVSECGRNPVHCNKCSFPNCNSNYLVSDPTILCVQCDRNPACMWSFRSTTRRCQKQVAFYKTESCYQHLYPNGVMAKRGCTQDSSFCSENDCRLCTDHICNGESYSKQSCVRCRSNGTDEASRMCQREAHKLAGEHCIVDPTYAERGCFTFRDGE